jgi:hypothetical protein
MNANGFRLALAVLVVVFALMLADRAVPFAPKATRVLH